VQALAPQGLAQLLPGDDLLFQHLFAEELAHHRMVRSWLLGVCMIHPRLRHGCSKVVAAQRLEFVMQVLRRVHGRDLLRSALL